MTRIENILKEKKIKGYKWDEVAKGLPISGNGLRVAFARDSVDEVYLDVAEQNLGISAVSKNVQVERTERKVVSDSIESRIALEVYKLIKEDIDKNTSLLIGLQELLSRTEATESKVDKIYEAMQKAEILQLIDKGIERLKHS